MNGIIELEGIKKYYRVGNQTVKALDGVTLSIARNEYVAVMGPSGSGKSTIMNILGCLDVQTEGSYVLNGTSVGGMDDDELSAVRNREIGFVFQSFNLLPGMTALDNVALPLIYAGVGRKERRERAMQCLEMVSLAERALHHPGEMSGGQRQRVAVARALVGNPAIILADEPTGNLDTATSYEVMALFDEIHSRGNTIILVTHEEDIAGYAHRIVRLRDGRIETDEQNIKH